MRRSFFKPITPHAWILVWIPLVFACAKNGAPTPIAMDDGIYMAMTEPPKTGIWYSTWYANEGTYLWADSTSGDPGSATRRFVADVNGDGLDDAVVFNGSDGTWRVALSNGNGFGPFQIWKSGFGSSGSEAFCADVNGDGRADAITQTGGTWQVALSNGRSFGSSQTWLIGASASVSFLGDVNGDHKSDLVLFSSNGTWQVALSSGFEFLPPFTWLTGMGSGGATPMLGDLNGDGRADAVVYQGGTWTAALSSGLHFGAPRTWLSGFGSGASRLLLGDTDGDDKDDAIAFYGDGAPWTWARAISTGSAFSAGEFWKRNHGRGSQWQATGRIRGPGAVDLLAWHSDQGAWKALPANKHGSPVSLNTWEAWNVRYRPRTRGGYGRYDSGDPDVLDEHLDLIEQAGIDFVLLDETNNVYVEEGYILDRAKALCKAIAARKRDHSLKYAIAVGGMQFDGNVAKLDFEAGVIWNEFIANPDCGGTDTYYQLDGKPLLVSYASLSQRRTWEAHGTQQWTSRFTLKWAQGSVPDGLPTAIYGQYLGWGVPYGSVGSSATMIAMPGWNNHLGTYVSRLPGGAFYRQSNWERILSRLPQLAIIVSFNDYVEETAVAPASTSDLRPPSEPWTDSSGREDPDLYWNLTRDYVRRYKELSAKANF